MLGAILIRGSVFSAIWWLLAEGRADSWGVGTASILAALVASLMLSPPVRVRFSTVGIVRLAAFFLLESIRGGIQVALAAFKPRMPLAPDLVAVTLRLPEGLPRVFLMNMLSLLPGTVSVLIEGDTLWLHVLDRTQPIAREVERVETRIAHAMKLEITT